MEFTYLSLLRIRLGQLEKTASIQFINTHVYVILCGINTSESQKTRIYKNVWSPTLTYGKHFGTGYTMRT